ncbi:MAG: metallophosphoesterase [Bulleidia sp.]|nr:metallophosphoesterase [Bulleidia sp.]
MKILALADEEEKSLYDYWTPKKTEDVDLIVSCGDLHAEYLEFLNTIGNKPLIYVPGNHDEGYARRPPLGCDDIDDTIYVYKGVRFLGLGGSMKYKNSDFMYTEEEMEKRIKKLKKTLKQYGGFDVLVTHAPARGYGDLEDLPHRGFECFNALLEEYHPQYLLHGHVHAAYSSDFHRATLHPGGTMIINCYGSVYLDVKPDPSFVMPEKKHGFLSFLKKGH